MHAKALKRLILFFTLLIALIVCIQLFWLNKIYSFEQRQFTTNVVKAVRGLFEDIEYTNVRGVQVQQLIDRPDANTFLIRVDSIPPKDSLVYYLTAEMEDFDVFADCRMGVYGSKHSKYLYQLYLPMPASHSVEDPGTELPLFKKSYPYILLNFPYRRQYILHAMNWWIFLSGMLLIVLIGLGASLFYLYKQKFLNEIQSDFIKNVTHEFQTPLTTLRLGLDLLSRPAAISQPGKLDEYTSVMKTQAEYLQHHIENLVKAIRTESVGLTLNKEMLSPNNLVRDAIIHFNFLISEQSAKIECNFEKEDRMIHADRANLYLAILNLLSNAIKYSHEPRIVVSTGMENGFYCIGVKDNGIGIEKKYLRQVFKKFYRVPTGDIHNVKGLGLGLYFVKKIIALHRGKLIVNSVPGAGSEFKVLLPI